MSKADTYRQNASDCLRLVEHITSPDERAVLVKMANKWHQLAQEQERIERREKE